jgi:hypothetical protein
MNTSTSNLEPEDLNYCANPGCHCLVQPEEEFCCDKCEQHQDEDGPCQCGHSDCEPKQ